MGKEMGNAYMFEQPTLFSGLQGTRWTDLPNEISAGITLVVLIIQLNIGYAQVSVAVSCVNESTVGLLVHYHLIELMGKNRLSPTNRHAIAAFRRETG